MQRLSPPFSLYLLLTIKLVNFIQQYMIVPSKLDGNPFAGQTSGTVLIASFVAFPHWPAEINLNNNPDWAGKKSEFQMHWQVLDCRYITEKRKKKLVNITCLLGAKKCVLVSNWNWLNSEQKMAMSWRAVLLFVLFLFYSRLY